ncbi:energy-coupling factor transporter transmembrane component T [Bifidobacterium platyrrhinorum]|uniref:Energy-coupling factor transporter transmembrane protein EcfT n=1 Tax=Bifidobacterium platyrrhinorum TaxID=2661628 RepID=A0A6L9SSL9_9BIFI|nr:energy-coupling factor transporter transmembrane component T [Bifidobacterium platyrrhinorum]NEG55518.1 energy-coupling factor transporter transmembrane protein EcfT [Bifidobacterium platyrrhinorum]
MPGTPGAAALDPRTKLVLLLLANLMLFLHAGAATQAIMTALFLLPLVAAGRRRMATRFAALYTVLAVAAMLDPESLGAPWLHVIPALAVGLGMMLPCLITGAYAVSTTTASAFVCAMRRMRVPESVVVPCVVVIRFFPTIAGDYRRIRETMALRGLVSGRFAALRHPMRMLEHVLVPLLMNAAFVAQDLSVAALTKGLGRSGVHTSRTTIRMRAVDWLFMLACAAPLALDTAGVIG